MLKNQFELFSASTKNSEQLLEDSLDQIHLADLLFRQVFQTAQHKLNYYFCREFQFFTWAQSIPHVCSIYGKGNLYSEVNFVEWSCCKKVCEVGFYVNQLSNQYTIAADKAMVRKNLKYLFSRSFFIIPLLSSNKIRLPSKYKHP